MQRRPRDTRAGIFTRPLVVLLMVGGPWSTLVNIGLFTWLLRAGRPVAEATAMTFSFGWTDWAPPAAPAFTIVPALEAVKRMERRGYVGELR